MPLLEARGLTRDYQTGETCLSVVRGVDLQIERGKSVAIRGRSGSGKSTLLHLLAGIDAPTSGAVLFEGQNFADMDDESRSVLRRRRIGLVFQAFNLLPNMVAVDNVAMPLVIDGAPRSEARPQASELLRKLGLEARARHLPSRLSGGEQQRVAIARALIIKPAVILADEPTGNLDTENGQAVMELLYGLTSDHGATLVVVTHDPGVAQKAQRQIHLVDGRIQQDTDDAHRDVLPV